MIVCICNNVSDKAIRQAVGNGACTISALREKLAVGTCCGKCHSCAKTILRDCLEDQASHPVVFQPAFAAA